ncbi:MAG: hypothetical protein IT462_09765 [Planctomycetes bacterium]|nr:hypothetical protein [Planctomycetota bacterium]
MNLRLDSVVFSTRDLPRVRAFYADVLGLKVGSFEKDGKVLPDEGPKYVNFKAGDTLLCFETGDSVETGTIVLACPDLAGAKAELARAKVKLVKEHPAFLIIHDPDGREIILQG